MEGAKSLVSRLGKKSIRGDVDTARNDAFKDTVKKLSFIFAVVALCVAVFHGKGTVSVKAFHQNAREHSEL